MVHYLTWLTQIRDELAAVGEKTVDFELVRVALVIARLVGWAKPDTIHNCETITGKSTHCHLR